MKSVPKFPDRRFMPRAILEKIHPAETTSVLRLVKWSVDWLGALCIRAFVEEIYSGNDIVSRVKELITAPWKNKRDS